MANELSNLLNNIFSIWPHPRWRYKNAPALRSGIHNSCISVGDVITFVLFLREHPTPALTLSGSSNPLLENKYHIGQDLDSDRRSSYRSCELSDCTNSVLGFQQEHGGVDLIADRTHGLSFGKDGIYITQFFFSYFKC